MSKGLPRSLSRGEALQQEVLKFDESFTLASFVVNDPGAAAGWATAVLRGLPQGNLLLLGAVVYMELTKVGAGISATWSGDFALGSAPTADNSLAGAEVDVVPSTPIGPAVAGVSPRTRGAGVTGVLFDNTDGSLELNVNILVDDADITAADNMTARGTIHLAFIGLGDD